VALLIDVAYETILPLSLKFLVDKAIEPKDWHAFVLILGILVVGYVVSVASAVGRDYLYAWLGGQVLHDFRIRMYGHLQRQSMDFFGRMRSGDLLSRFTTDLAAVENCSCWNGNSRSCSSSHCRSASSDRASWGRAR
jgi:ATP-binding cassette, subfamily B, bacterial